MIHRGDLPKKVIRKTGIKMHDKVVKVLPTVSNINANIFTQTKFSLQHSPLISTKYDSKIAFLK